MLNILAWGVCIIVLAVVLFLILFVRYQLKLMAKKRRRWALAVGLPARFAELHASEHATEFNAPDPELSISIADFKDDIDWLKKNYFPQVVADDVPPEECRHIALTRIGNHLANVTARRMGHQPLDGYAIRDAMAWDTSMLVEEARLAETLGWLSEEEVWGYLFLNGQKVQDCFESWQDFTDSAVRGREYLLRVIDGVHASPRLATAIAEVHVKSTSSFGRVPWRDFRILEAGDTNTALPE